MLRLARITASFASIALLAASTSPARAAACTGFGFNLLAGGPVANTSVALGGEVAVHAVTGDVNADGFPDVISANVNSGDIVIALGTGSGSLAPTPASPIDIPNNARATGLGLGDFNADGRLDVVVSQLIVGATVFLGNGAGGFTAAGSVGYGTGANVMERVAVGDFDRDGRLDVALTDAGQDRLRLAFGDGLGGLIASPTLLTSPALDLPLGLAAGDVTGDGILDLVTVGGLSDQMVVFAGNGAGGFTTASTHPAVLDASALPRDVTLSDVDGDGRLDALVATRVFRNSAATPPSPFNRALVFAGTTGGLAATGTPVGVGSDVQSLVAADFNDDGRVDLAAANGAFGFRGALALRQPDGSHLPPLLVEAGGDAQSVLAADFDADGFIDLALVNAGLVPSLSMHLNACVTDPVFGDGFEAP
jgi:hypothetical protein